MNSNEAINHILSSASYWSRNGDPLYKPTLEEKRQCFEMAVNHVFNSHGVDLSLAEIEQAKRKFGIV